MGLRTSHSNSSLPRWRLITGLFCGFMVLLPACGPQTPSGQEGKRPAGPPRDLQGIASVGAIKLSWRPPEDPGSDPVLSYRVLVSPAPEQPVPTVKATEYTLSGLAKGTAYTLSVIARSSAGESEPSAPLTLSTPREPAAPLHVEATPGDASALVRWTAPEDGGSPSHTYQVRSSPGDVQVTTGELHAVVSGLTPGTEYTFTVTATNAVGTSVESEPSNALTPYVGSCRTLKQVDAAAGDGPRTVTVAGEPAQVYCDMTTDGGGWTLVLHSTFTGTAPADLALTQNHADWQSRGVGTVADFTGQASNTMYVMPLERWRRMAESASSLRFQSDNHPSLTVLEGFTMNATYGLSGTNRSTVANVLCGALPGCFLNDVRGFTSFDKAPHDAAASCCQLNGNIGWWYEGCHLYHPFLTDTRFNFSGTSDDPETNHWTWWMR